MDGISTLLADLGRVVGSPAEPSSPKRPSLLGINAAPALGRRPRTSSLYTQPVGSSSAADSTSKATLKRLSTVRRPSILTSSQSGSGSSTNLSGTHASGSVKVAAREQWRSLGPTLTRGPSDQVSLMLRRQEAQVAVPSWLHGTVAPSAFRASATSHATSCTSVASDVLAQIDASMYALRHAPAGAAPAKSSAAGDMLAISEASLQPPSPQQEHTLPALADHSGSQLAADNARDIDKLLSTPASSQRVMHQPSVSPRYDGADHIYGGESTMQQLLPGRNALGYHIAVTQQPKAVYADVHTAPPAMHQEHEWIMDSPALDEAQDSYVGEHFLSDHRRQHIHALLQRNLLEPASLSELGATWSSRPLFDPHLSTLRFKEEPRRLLEGLDAWAQAEEQASRTFDAKVQRWYGF